MTQRQSTYYARQRARGARTRAVFYEAVADGMMIMDAAGRASISVQRAQQFMKELRDYYGWQAR